MDIQFLPYAKQSISQSDLQAVSKALEQDVITRGDHVEAFERSIANYCGAEFAVAFNSGTTGMQAAAFAAGLSPYDRWITTPNTFIATIVPAFEKRIDPVFIDIDRQTGNMDLNLLEPNLVLKQSRGKTFIVPVHFSGIAVDMKKLESLIKNEKCVVIEDAAHAFGSCYPYSAVRVGSCQWSDMTVFSFHPAKTITTGEGGIVTTNDEHLYRRLRLYRNNGIERQEEFLEKGKEAPDYYEVQFTSGNYNFTEFQAALGLSQLQRIDYFIEQRKKLVNLYRELLKKVDGVKVFVPDYDDFTCFHLFVVQIDFRKLRKNRSEMMQTLKDQKGIGSQVHYIPLYHHPIFKNDLAEYYPETEKYYQECLSLPLYPAMNEVDVKRAVKALGDCLQS